MIYFFSFNKFYLCIIANKAVLLSIKYKKNSVINELKYKISVKLSKCKTGKNIKA